MWRRVDRGLQARRVATIGILACLPVAAAAAAPLDSGGAFDSPSFRSASSAATDDTWPFKIVVRTRRLAIEPVLRGSRIGVVCEARCGTARPGTVVGHSRRAKPRKRVATVALQRIRFRAGTRFTVRVTAPGRISRYTTYRISRLAGALVAKPQRHGCLTGAGQPTRCGPGPRSDLDTATYATVVEVLNGRPGWVTVNGQILTTGVGAPVDGGAHVDLDFERWSDGRWAYEHSVRATVSNGYYEIVNWRLDRGLWRTRAVFPAQGPFNRSESTYHQLELGGGYQLVARHSGKCIDVMNASTANGAQIQQWQCTDPALTPQQVFTLVPSTGSSYQIVNRHSGKCLDVSGASLSAGTSLQQWDCFEPSRAHQSWRRMPVNAGYVQLRARSSDQCVDVAGVSASDGALLQQYHCLGASQANQLWLARSVD